MADRKTMWTVSDKPGYIDQEEFVVILKDITAGTTVTLEEIEDVVAYSNAVPEMVALIKALSNGYKVLLGRIEFKNKTNGALKRQLEALRRRLKKMEEDRHENP